MNKFWRNNQTQQSHIKNHQNKTKKTFKKNHFFRWLPITGVRWSSFRHSDLAWARNSFNEFSTESPKFNESRSPTTTPCRRRLSRRRSRGSFTPDIYRKLTRLRTTIGGSSSFIEVFLVTISFLLNKKNKKYLYQQWNLLYVITDNISYITQKKIKKHFIDSYLGLVYPDLITLTKLYRQWSH